MLRLVQIITEEIKMTEKVRCVIINLGMGDLWVSVVLVFVGEALCFGSRDTCSL